MTAVDRIRSLAARLYGDETGREVAERILAGVPAAGPAARPARFTGSDAILITYADTLRRHGEPPLATLRRFIAEELDGYSHVHLLPFFPASGDGGFAVVDYRQVAPGLGDWSDVTALGADRGLMVDLVLNHVSVRSEWFRGFLAGEPRYQEWFHAVDGEQDLSGVFRPRTHPLLTTYTARHGPVRVWTTFSPEQADLNFAHPPVLEEMIRVMLGYVERGADVIRLDAVGYLWKEVGTACLHHPKTHLVVKLLRAVLDHAAPHVLLVSETNVPHADNVSYFGADGDEVQMVYNFSLPPLILDAFLNRDTTRLAAWASGLDHGGEGVFLNFIASHDGIGLAPVEGLLTPGEVDEMARRVEAAGGRWSGRSTGGGGVRPYELNISYLDALAAMAGGEGDDARRLLAAASIQMSLKGVPGVYVHSAVGTRSWWDGPARTGEARSINRAVLDADVVTRELSRPGSRRRVVRDGHADLLGARARSGAFDPGGSQEVLDQSRSVFSLLRATDAGEVWCVTNVTPEAVTVAPPAGWERRRSMFGDEEETGEAELAPYGFGWYRR